MKKLFVVAVLAVLLIAGPSCQPFFNPFIAIQILCHHLFNLNFFDGVFNLLQYITIINMETNAIFEGVFNFPVGSEQQTSYSDVFLPQSVLDNGLFTEPGTYSLNSKIINPVNGATLFETSVGNLGYSNDVKKQINSTTRIGTEIAEDELRKILKPAGHGISGLLYSFANHAVVTDINVEAIGYDLTLPNDYGYFSIEINPNENVAAVVWPSGGATKGIYPTRVDYSLPEIGYINFLAPCLPDSFANWIYGLFDHYIDIKINTDKGMIIGNVKNKAGLAVKDCIVQTSNTTGQAAYFMHRGIYAYESFELFSDKTFVQDGADMSGNYFIANVDTTKDNNYIKVYAIHAVTGETLGVKETVFVQKYKDVLTFAPIIVSDDVAPSMISDLRLESDAVNNYLTWTATGDDGSSGKAYRYRLYYAKAPREDESLESLYYWINSAIELELTLNPKDAGEKEILILDTTNYDANGENYYLIQVIDESANRSGFSNMVGYNPMTVSEKHPEFNLELFSSGSGMQIRFNAEAESQLRLKIFDIQGSLVQNFDLVAQSETNQFTWDLKSKTGDVITDGVYFVTLNADSHTLSKKVLVIK